MSGSTALFEELEDHIGYYLRDTIFVIFVTYGDHGEGFGEHGRFQHNDTL